VDCQGMAASHCRDGGVANKIGYPNLAGGVGGVR
jgi:hypothetical protein